MTRLFGALLVSLISLAHPLAAQDGGPFSPRLIVSGSAITNYEVDQRMRFLRLLNTPGNIEEGAVEALIEDRLRLDAGKLMGISAPEELVLEGMAEFASRADLSVDEFVKAIAEGGIERDTFYDFVEAGVVWREVIRARFGPRSQITEAEIDRALALSSQRGGARVLLSEIILRADTPAFKAQSEALAERLSREITTPAAFAAAARRYSVSGSRGRGGRIDWLELSNLPPQLSSLVLSLGPGEVTEPVPIPNAIALFQLRAIEELDANTPDTLAVEYAQFLLPAGASAEAQKVVQWIDACDDLYGVAKGLPEDRLLRDTKPVAELPQDIALELAKLDEGETSILNRGAATVVLMLCGRTPDLGEDVDRDTVRNRLRNQRLASYADGYLAELRSDAIIQQK